MNCIFKNIILISWYVTFIFDIQRFLYMRRYINETISEYLSEPKKVWHMPGHKRKDAVFGRDMTEVPGMDDLHHPEGMIKLSMEEAAKVYDSYKTYYLVNGSTCGNMAALFACVKSGGPRKAVIVARNCHKSVFNTLQLLDVKPVYVYPERSAEVSIDGRISAGDIRRAILSNSNLEISCCIITSPTYEGVISDIRGISEVLHSYGIRLIVDEAHGAHFPFYRNTEGAEERPVSALYLGADIVIQSLHKTLPCYTQTAVLHIAKETYSQLAGDNSANNAESVERYLRIFQTSSPSYIFLQAMEECIARCDEKRYEFGEHYKRIEAFRDRFERSGMENIRLFSFPSHPESEMNKTGEYELTGNESDICTSGTDGRVANVSGSNKPAVDELEICTSGTDERTANVLGSNESEIYTSGTDERTANMLGSNESEICTSGTNERAANVPGLNESAVDESEICTSGTNGPDVDEISANTIADGCPETIERNVTGSNNAAQDITRLVFMIRGISGREAAELLEKQTGVVVEMAETDYITAISTIADSEEDFDQLFTALQDLDRTISEIKENGMTNDKTWRAAGIMINVAEGRAGKDVMMDVAADGEAEKIMIRTDAGELPLAEAVGRRVVDYIYVYPPGIPIIAPFEIIEEKHVNEIKHDLAAGHKLRYGS